MTSKGNNRKYVKSNECGYDMSQSLAFHLQQTEWKHICFPFLTQKNEQCWTTWRLRNKIKVCKTSDQFEKKSVHTLSTSIKYY